MLKKLMDCLETEGIIKFGFLLFVSMRLHTAKKNEKLIIVCHLNYGTLNGQIQIFRKRIIQRIFHTFRKHLCYVNYVPFSNRSVK